MLSVELVRDVGRVTLRLVGDLDVASRPRLLASLAGIQDVLSDDTQLVIDLAGLTFCDAAGVGDLLDLVRRAGERCCGAVVADPPRQVMMIARALRLELPLDAIAR